MDECYWLGGGITDVSNHVSNVLNGEAMNGAQISTSEQVIGFSGGFNLSSDEKQNIDIDKDSSIDFDQSLTITLWVKPLDANDSHLVNRYDGRGTSTTDDDLGFKLHYRSNKEQLRFILMTTTDRYRLNLAVDQNTWNDGNWHFITARYDGSEMFLSFDDINATKSATGTVKNATSLDLFLASKSNGARALSGYLDEVKLWDKVLTAAELQTIRSNEENGLNYDGSAREAVVCDASITAHSWELIGIPADLRTESNTSIGKILGDDMNGTYGTDWRIYKREYSDSNNSSWYTYLSDINMALEFGTAYWLGSKNSENWNVNDMQAVDYNATNSACTAGTCVEIDLKSVTHDFDTDGDDGTGPYRYYMTGFTGKSPVDWADCRFIIGGTVYTPSNAENNGYASKTIWQYNPNSSEADGKGYTTCDDVTPGSCMLVPYKGFWVELHGPTKGKSVKLLIPKE
jgi:hypothetical protein